MTVDVAIAGAGPAGSATALRLARLGYNVLLLEREALPRYKVCGGGVTRKALENLPFDASDVLECAPTRGRITIRGTNAVTIDTGSVVAWTTMRDKFDARIVQEAVKAGATLRERCRVIGIENGTLQTSQGPVEARVIVGADGAPSRIGQALGISPARRHTPAVEAEVAVSAELVDQWRGTVLFDFHAAQGGYGWIFPKADHLSIGLCSLSGKVNGLREQTAAYVESLLGKTGWTIVSIKGHLLPIGGPTGPLHNGNVLVVGDAAGAVDPFTGEGIAHALHGAKEAATAIDAYLAGRTPDLAPYSEAMARHYRREFRLADQVGQFIYRHPTLSHRLLMRNRYIASRFIGVVAGDQGYRAFLRSCFSHPIALMAGYLPR